jgi:phosphoribosylformylglycinamidine synthase I
MTKRLSPSGELRVGVLQFPGSNCDADCVDALKRHFNIDATQVWHQSTSLPPLDAIIIPGGFSFGDYLRSGALAAHSPIMRDVKHFAARGGSVLGICNGFQILVESQMLPGALLHNTSLSFICKSVYLRDSRGRALTMPIAHGEGRYWIDERGLADIEDSEMIAYQYASSSGGGSLEFNPNGSVANIAGVRSKNKRVLGMMPHPERATDIFMGGSADGLAVLRDFLEPI